MNIIHCSVVTFIAPRLASLSTICMHVNMWMNISDNYIGFDAKMKEFSISYIQILSSSKICLLTNMFGFIHAGRNVAVQRLNETFLCPGLQKKKFTRCTGPSTKLSQQAINLLTTSSQIYEKQLNQTQAKRSQCHGKLQTFI